MKIIIQAHFLMLAMLLMACKSDEIVNEQLIVAGNTKNHSGDTILMDSFSQTLYARISKPKTSGLYYSFDVPEDLQNKHFYIVFKGRVRTNFPQTSAGIVLMAFDKHKQQLCWMSLPLRSFIIKQNDWNTFLDSIHIPNVMNDVIYTSLKAFPYSGKDSLETLDIDTFLVTLRRTEGSNRFK